MSGWAHGRHALPLVCLALVVSACDDEKTLPTAPEEIRTLISLSASQDTLPADGLSELTLTATLRTADPDPNKLTVQFRATGGTLVGGQTVAASVCGEPSCVDVQADPGSLTATARLRSSTIQGPVTVTAVLTAVGVQATRVVEFAASDAVLDFAGTSSTGEADGETAIRVVVRADPRVAPGKMITISATSGTFVGDDDSVDLPLATDSRVETQFKSLAEPGSTILTATVQGESLAAARHEISFLAAFADAIQLESSAATVAVGASVSLTAEYFRSPGAGSVTEGLQPTWRADKVDDDGNVLAIGVGRLSDVTTVQPDAGDASKRKSTATFEPEGLVAGDRVAITVRVEDGGATGEVVVTVE